MKWSRLTLAAIATACLLGCASPQKSTGKPPHHSDDVENVVRYAKACYERGELERAKAALELVLNADPGNAAAEYYMGAIAASEAAQKPGRVRDVYPTLPPQAVSTPE
jgi:tetratricopeptide (TPR) repeat protein